MSETMAFTDLLDDAAFMSLEHQLHLVEVLGEHSWRVDMGAGIFAFDTARGTVECSDFHFLGSAAPDSGTWLWSWANPSGFPEHVSALAAAVRDFGAEHGVHELSTAEIAFESFPVEPEPFRVAAVQAEAAKVLTGRWTSYLATAGTDMCVAFLVEHPRFQLPPPEPTRVLRVLNEGLAGLALRDPRRAVTGYLHHRGLDPEFSPDYRQLAVEAPGMTGTVDFDERGRVASIDMRLSAPR